MSKDTILKYTYDKNFKHKRHDYGYIGSGVCIEIGFWNAIWDILSSPFRNKEGEPVVRCLIENFKKGC